MAAKPSSKAKSAGRKSAAAPKAPPKSHAVGKKRRGKAAAADHLRQAVSRNITERKIARDRIELAAEVLQILNQPNDLELAIGEILLVVKGRLGFDAVGIRLSQDGDFPYFVQDGFSDAFVMKENSLCLRDEEGRLIRDPAGNPLLECMCGTVLSGRTDPNKPFFTEAGSFWTNSTTDLLASTSEKDRQGRTRNRCNREGYESVALVPLRSGNKIIGLLQLNDHRRGLLSVELVRFLESLGTSIGIAARRQLAAHVLAESEEKYRILFQTMAQGVVYQSADGKIISANPAAERILGLTLDQMQGRTSIDPRWRAIHEDGSDFPGQTHPAMVALQTGREVRDVVMGVYNPRTESHVWINVNAVPRIEPGDDKPYQVYTTFDDITERKRAEEDMRQMAALPLQNPNPVLAMSMEGQLLFVSPAAARTFPTLSAEGLRHCILADWPSVADALRRRSPPMVRREVAVDGAWYLQIFFHAAELDRVLVYLVDITDRKRAEEAARKAQAELLDERQHEKEHAEAELAQMRDRLVRATRLAAIGQVSASIAHDLRNPLGTVRNAAYYLGRRLPKDQPEVAEYLGIINQEVAAADRIITNLLAVAGAKEPVKQHVDVGQAIREALAETGQAEAVRLRMSLAPEPFMVRADPDHLRQVFRNLVANAAEAMGDGGEIVVEAARDADGDSIVLRDTGPGVAQEIRETVFEPLVTTKAKGIGLGLTICRQIIEHHGGSIELIDEDRPGAAFRIRLPRQ